MKKLLTVLFLFITSVVTASHIVGGEFELQYVSREHYILRLILYFDKVHGSEGALDLQAKDVTIYSKQFNIPMMMVTLPLIKQEDVLYSDMKCAIGELETIKLIYELPIFLSESIYTEEMGYYVTWERCCRNYNIDNIYSEDPNSGGQYAGQTFYLEFPPIVQNGQPFINSSPTLNPPLTDYACPNKKYYVDFKGTDVDGDSMAYSLVTPLSTHTGDAFPPVWSAPYPEIAWRPGFGMNNILNGSPDLTISTDGFLQVYPTTPGLYVFAVKCEEYRDGVKIGELRRDFQMLVVSGCDNSVAPVITGRKVGDSNYTSSLSLYFDNTVADADRCIEVKITDADAFGDKPEYVKIKLFPIGFKSKNLNNILPAVKDAYLTPGSPEVTFKLCFDACPIVKSGHFQFAVVAYDDACSLPLDDSVKVNVYIEPPVNNDPFFETPDVTESLHVTQVKTWDISGIDPDLDPLVTTVKPKGFALADYGLSVKTIKLENGEYDAQLTWDPDCNTMNFANKRDFQIKLTLDDVDKCKTNIADTMTFNLHLDVDPNQAPTLEITSASAVELENNKINAFVQEPIVLNLSSTDPDAPPQNFITLDMRTLSATVPPAGVQFSPVSGESSVATTFSWTPDCSVFANGNWQSQFQFQFLTYDKSCIGAKGDTITIDVTIDDIPANREAFLPPNLITPNGDGKNDFFGLDEIVKMDDSDHLPNLPADNCQGKFLSITIFNRWGKKVFQSDRRDFRWYINNEANGIYFYTVHYTNAEYKGTLSIKY